jgi:membrane protein YqaA with SNARE-associated domain
LIAIELVQAYHENNPMSGGCAQVCGSLTKRYSGELLLLVALSSLGGCNGAPSRNILGSYFPSWMVCALLGIAAAGIGRTIFKATGVLQELPVPFVVLLAIGCAATFALWLVWLG